MGGAALGAPGWSASCTDVGPVPTSPLRAIAFLLGLWLALNLLLPLVSGRG